MAQRAALPHLRAFVSGYLASSSLLPQPVRERLLPSIEVPLFLNFGAPHRRLETDTPTEWTARDGAWIVGLHNRPQLSEAAGERDFMIVRFTPLGAHHFLRTPMHLIRRQAVDLCELDPKLARLVMSRVGVVRNWEDRFAAMEALIAERVGRAAAPSGLAFAWRRLEAADGRVPIGALASEVGCSHRTLIDQFRTGIGVTPKAMERVFRFNRAIRSLDASSRNRTAADASKPYIETETAGPSLTREPRWADLAAGCGYFDQAHFIKEFRQFSGVTPTEFLRRMADVS
ncbi:MAG TPA: helix-turn-helix domain-containing protein [Phenylobacterium sp.]